MQNIFNVKKLKEDPSRVRRVRRWIKALRSGDYKQARSVLFRTNKRGEERYCCLGVMIDLVDPKPWKALEDVGGFVHWHPLAVNRGASMPGSKACDMYGLRFTDNPKAGACYLANRNDHLATFKVIADILDGALKEALKK